ncbi:FAD/NAD(P)-binding domain-containing protein [Microthyrium microscopicum]|uniref:FAD/NAD(P)-binding domain-containing protein n=1 Tax=Microthyrium microscopicum TaxID=703497 RepID=A0A6A6UKU0_9PEZI|nr:FAD/NAD(P)-binding domain-containing protein [Microthyrium microscopicum]
MPVNKVLILGGGIAGIALAIALTKSNIPVEIFEIRDEPSNIGGAVNLTPNAMRYLEYLGVSSSLMDTCECPAIEIFSLRTGAKLAALSFDDVNAYKFRARRVIRSALIHALIQTLGDLNVSIQYNKRATSISETSDSVTLQFADGTSATGSLLVGADGVHSFVRSHIDPSRTVTYTGVASAYAFLPASSISARLPFVATALYSGRAGSVLLSYTDAARTQLYAGLVMEVPAPDSDLGREGWRAHNKDREAVRRDLTTRFASPAVPQVSELIEKVDEWWLRPVYKLPPSGVWWKGQSVLVGDAAHAMPPQGESIGLALEDVVLLTRVLEKHGGTQSAGEMFEAAWEEASWRWESVKDKGVVATWAREIMTPWVLWFMQGKKAKEMMYDVREIEI